MLGYICDAGYISDGGYMGSAPCPQCRDAAAIRGVRTRREDAGYLGSQPQAPNISDGVYLGECPSPRVYMGSAPCPQDRRCRYSGSPNPFKDASYLGSQPQAPNISDGMYLGESPSPSVFMGSAPCPPRQTLPLFGRMPEPL